MRHPRFTRHTEPGPHGFRLHGVVTGATAVGRALSGTVTGAAGREYVDRLTHGIVSDDSRAHSEFTDVLGAMLVQSRHVLNRSTQSFLRDEKITRLAVGG